MEWHENLNADGEFILNVAWKAAHNPYLLINDGNWKDYRSGNKPYKDLPVSDNAADIGIAFNPATIRSEHQLHVHVVRPRKTLLLVCLRVGHGGGS